jgi:Autographiviridae endonuclease VII
MTCSTCQEDKVETEFSLNKSEPRGYQYTCKECFVKINRKRRYGLTQDQYMSMFISQQGRCAICGILGSDAVRGALCVDHDHVSGKVRGLLCHLCNSAIGKLHDSVELLLNAVAYLERNAA